MKRELPSTIRMSADHWPTLDLGVHVPDDPRGLGRRCPWGLFAPKSSAMAGSYQVQRARGRPKWPPGTPAGLTGESSGVGATGVADNPQNLPVTLKMRPESFHS